MDELQEKKLTRLFSLLDRDADGALEQSDYEAIGDQVAAHKGLVAGSPEYAQMLWRMQIYWVSLLKRADKDANQQISLDEWVASMGAGSEDMQQSRGMMVALASTLLDRDGDGSITAADYDNLFTLLGHKMNDHGAVFAHLDTNGDGKIDNAELATLVDEFLFSSDPNAAGNWLLGPL